MFNIEELEKFKEQLPLKMESDVDTLKVSIINNNNEELMSSICVNREVFQRQRQMTLVMVEMANTFKKTYNQKEKQEKINSMIKEKIWESPNFNASEIIPEILRLTSELITDNYILNAQIEALVYTSLIQDKANKYLGKKLREKEMKINIGDITTSDLSSKQIDHQLKLDPKLINLEKSMMSSPSLEIQVLTSRRSKDSGIINECKKDKNIFTIGIIGHVGTERL